MSASSEVKKSAKVGSWLPIAIGITVGTVVLMPIGLMIKDAAMGFFRKAKAA